MQDPEGHAAHHWAALFEEIDLEIVRHALACHVALLDHGVITRVLHGDAGVCGQPNPQAFASLRSLLMLHYSVQDRAIVSLGLNEAVQLVAQVHARLRRRVGHQLGGPPS
jgi:hypothetical protein